MQIEREPKFLKHHQAHVRAVEFSPTERYLFCSGGYDGKVILYSALRGEHLASYQLASSTLAKNINGVRFNCNGTKIMTATTARRVAVLDVEKGTQILAYNNCIFGSRECVGLSPNPANPDIAVCAAVNGKGLTLLDLRMPLPVDFLYNVHNGMIRDVHFVPSSWPWVRGVSNGFLLAGNDGMCKVVDSTGQNILSFYSGQDHLNSADFTPEPYCENPITGLYSMVLLAGNCITSYIPDRGVTDTFYETPEQFVKKIKYSTNGSMLYAVCGDGKVRKYRRHSDHHEYLGKVLYYTAEAQDVDISLYDEYIAIAFKERTVGLLNLGMPSHGSTEYCDLT